MKVERSKIFAAVTTIVLFTGAYALIASQIDGRIESSVKKSYVYKTYLNDDAITVKSRNGVVTLTGSVADETHKLLARETITNLPDVKSVDDRLAVKVKYPSENSDGWIGMKVKIILLFHRNVNAFKTKVDVEKGIVTLKGEASSETQKDLAGEYAGDVNGVKEVKNEMTVAAGPNDGGQTWGEMVDDASISAQVKVALSFHSSTSAVNTDVTTKDGVVTVSGMARNDAEKTMVGKLANDVKGAKGVVNKMTISE